MVPYRFKVDRTNKYFQFNDLILGEVKIPSDNIEDFSIARSDGSPTFILTNIIDDFLEGSNACNYEGMITQLIQYQTKTNIKISKSFLTINYAHIPLIHDMQWKKAI